MPPAMHMVTTPHLTDASRALRRRPSSRMWPARRAPVMPKGWPMEMAPPLTFRRSLGMPSLRWQYRAWEAKASLSSHRSMSSTLRPWRASSLGTAKTGPMPISSGSQPATAKPRKAPSGDRPRRSEEHTSELQSPCNLVCRLLLEKKKHADDSVEQLVHVLQHLAADP